ncbi:TatD family hydrolase [Corynebacterium sp. 153RC1]|uniref:TatD family hydrolase n=1 Tax=unclassified Corynebacterium TaxID=2624378 RepID=UPI00211BE9D6|nr:MULTISPECIES: TatD family hydrolase [unclassified Corynebacterium]MCQ9371048.1 TatD family hydrolase [Corynebacterium sp. 35RC1]MCQ9352595.1 TatD family hydrolase [Corynebacterium sp. 209RC1]MCQ9354779.1 TatD family hydrolase [Corynebacterium sp. 1222RC1]MCQ9356964.1 TatD family hydrolase [Corynebacterium sp. 122RC1]MCQ9359047.1 TatD family hydrolase [Corynebacterium sp. 142RC1]
MSKKKPRPQPAPYHREIPGLIDAHTHLTSCKDPSEDLLARASAAGVRWVCTVGDGLAEAQAALALAHKHEQVFAACAIHPTKAHQLDEQARGELQRLAADPRCVAVGETGLDTYWITHDPEHTADLDTQIEALRWHAELANTVAKPLMIHNREADAQLMEVLGELDMQVPVMLHCFSSELDVAQEAIARGYILSFAGNVTFRRNEHLREAARIAPIEQVFIETDAPYMTPEPFRGARNEPALIGHTAVCIADVRDMPVDDFAEQMERNFRRIYQIEG